MTDGQVQHSSRRRQALWALAWGAAAAASRVVRGAVGGAPVFTMSQKLRFFTPKEARRLDALGEALVPGARSAGLSDYIDRNVSMQPVSSLLIVRYLDAAPPYGAFYREGLRHLERYPDADVAAQKLSDIDPLSVMRAAGARQAWSGALGSAHIMGGTVMGTSPDTPVTDPFGRVHGFENLYIAGASVYPTGGAVNPTFTLHATTLRTVEHIIGGRPGSGASRAA